MFKVVIVFFLVVVQVYSRGPERFENSTCVNTYGQSGVCTTIFNCLKEFTSLQVDDICTWKGKDPIICCANNPIPTISSRISESKCEFFYPKPIKNIKPFAGGWLARPGEHPHMSALGWKLVDGKTDWSCGGNLISENFVLTAAHCVISRPDVVRVGAVNLLSERTIDSVDFQIVEIYIHSDYKTDENYNDIALIKLEQKEIEGFYFHPACLWPNEEIPVQVLNAMGYGTLSFAGPKANELYQGNLTISDFETCKNAYGVSSKYPNGIIDSQLCAGDPLGIQDMCQGDSGGPLQFTSLERGRERIHYLVGITSFGKACTGFIPAIYTRIYPYLDWIESIVWN